MVVERIVVGPLRTNCYLLADRRAKVGVLVDPGGEPRKILESASCHPLVIEYIILTHGHADHIAAVPELKRELPAAKVVAHRADAFMLESEKMSFGALVGISHSPIEADILIGESWTAPQAGSWRLAAIPTPGHSPGGVCFSVKGVGSAQKVLFSGDTLFKGTVGRTDIAGADHGKLMESIKGKLLTLPGETKVFPGHGRETTIGEERASFNF